MRGERWPGVHSPLQLEDPVIGCHCQDVSAPKLALDGFGSTAYVEILISHRLQDINPACDKLGFQQYQTQVQTHSGSTRSIQTSRVRDGQAGLVFLTAGI